MTNLGNEYMSKVEEVVREKQFREMRGQSIEKAPTWILKSLRVMMALKTVTMNQELTL